MSEFHYPAYRRIQSERSVSEISALLFRCSQSSWIPRCSLDIVAYSDQYGDGIAALTWCREARRPLR